jgi:hypothetical protein
MALGKEHIITEMEIHNWLISETSILQFGSFEELEDYAYDIGDDYKSDEILFYLAAYEAYNRNIGEEELDQ